MQIVERSVGDIDRLSALVAMEKHADAWQQLTPDTLRSVCACDYITPELER